MASAKSIVRGGLQAAFVAAAMGVTAWVLAPHGEARKPVHPLPRITLLSTAQAAHTPPYVAPGDGIGQLIVGSAMRQGFSIILSTGDDARLTLDAIAVKFGPATRDAMRSCIEAAAASDVYVSTAHEFPRAAKAAMALGAAQCLTEGVSAVRRAGAVRRVGRIFAALSESDEARLVKSALFQFDNGAGDLRGLSGIDLDTALAGIVTTAMQKDLIARHPDWVIDAQLNTNPRPPAGIGHVMKITVAEREVLYRTCAGEAEDLGQLGVQTCAASFLNRRAVDMWGAGGFPRTILANAVQDYDAVAVHNGVCNIPADEVVRQWVDQVVDGDIKDPTFGGVLFFYNPYGLKPGEHAPAPEKNYLMTVRAGGPGSHIEHRLYGGEKVPAYNVQAVDGGEGLCVRPVTASYGVKPMPRSARPS